MLTASASFIEGIEKWVRAVRADDFDAAKGHSDFCEKAGELMTIHPDFIRCFKQHQGDVEPREALSYICRFLKCATEGRAAAFKQSPGRNDRASH